MVSHPFSRDLAGVQKRMQDKPNNSQYTHSDIYTYKCTHVIPYPVLYGKSIWVFGHRVVFFIITFHYLIACCASQTTGSFNKQNVLACEQEHREIRPVLCWPFIVCNSLLLNCMFWHFARVSFTHSFVSLSQWMESALYPYHHWIRLFPFTMPLRHIPTNNNEANEFNGIFDGFAFR